MTDDLEPTIKAEPGRKDRGRRRGPFDYGELRLIVLDLMAERPRHGYDIIKTIGTRMGGEYRPSPGVIYPTLSWLESAGYARRSPEGGRKLYRVTSEGEAYLAANRDALADIGVHFGGSGTGDTMPDAVLQELEAIKRALRVRFARGPVDAAATAGIVAALRDAARAVGATLPPKPAAGAALRSVAEIATPAAEDYLVQLCAHFARRATVRRDGNQGHVTFSIGTCHLVAERGVLRIVAEAADPEAIGRVEDVVERHLSRFACNEVLSISWSRTRP